MASVPDEYTEAYNKLIAFRQKVFEKLVSGRVKVRLDANHETLVKYGEVIDQLSVVPYMFGNVRQKALALRMNSKDVSEGEIAQAKSNFALTKAIYPLDTPFNVPARMLPQVDVFKYDVPTDVSIVETTTESVWANLFVIQTAKADYKSTADVENVFYKFFKFRPVGRRKVEITLSEPQAGFGTWNKITGEATYLVRDIVKINEVLPDDYIIIVLVDANYHSITDEIGVVPIILIILSETASLPEVMLVCGGKRIKSIEKGVFSSWIADGQFVGWTKTHNDYAIPVADILWSNMSELVIDVNDLVMGTTDPVPNTYTKQSLDTVLITALPNSGYAVKNWMLDGIQRPQADTLEVTCYRNHNVICVFFKGGTLSMRPTANGDVKQLTVYGVANNYDAVDEELHDSDATFVYCEYEDMYRYDLYQLGNIELPVGAIVDSLTLFGTFRRVLRAVDVYSKFHYKLTGTDYTSESFVLPYDFDWHVLSKKLEKNPKTGNVWTESELNALQAGVGMNSKYFMGNPYDTGIRCTQFWCEVEFHVP